MKFLFDYFCFKKSHILNSALFFKLYSLCHFLGHIRKKILKKSTLFLRWFFFSHYSKHSDILCFRCHSFDFPPSNTNQLAISGDLRFNQAAHQSPAPITNHQFQSVPISSQDLGGKKANVSVPPP